MADQSKQLLDLQREVRELAKIVDDITRLRQQDIMPGAVKQRHIQGIIIFRGLEENLPADGSTEVQAYYAVDTSKLYIWNTEGEAWESELFT